MSLRLDAPPHPGCFALGRTLLHKQRERRISEERAQFHQTEKPEEGKGRLNTGDGISVQSAVGALTSPDHLVPVVIAVSEESSLGQSASWAKGAQLLPSDGVALSWKC